MNLSSPLSPMQKQILQAPLSGIHLLQGPTSSGKSFIANLKLFLTLTDPTISHQSFLASAPSYASLWQNVLHPLLQFDLPFKFFSVKREGSRPVITCSLNHNRLLAVSCACPSAASMIQGHNIRFWLADEATVHSESFVNMALSRLRFICPISGELILGAAFWSFNPSHSHHFIKRRFVDLVDNPSKTVADQFAFSDISLYRFSLDDNPTSSAKWKKSLESLFSGVFFQQMVQAQWSSPHALIYPQFSSDLVVSASSLDHRWLRSVRRFFWGVDWGFSHPMAILLIAQTRDSFFVVDELYRSQTLVDDQLFSFFSSKLWFSDKLSSVFADRSRPDLISSLQGLLCKHVHTQNIPVLPSTTSLQQGLHLIMHLLDKKKLRFSQNCVHTLREIQEYRFHSSFTDTPQKSSDHAMDALRYAISMSSTTFFPLEKDASSPSWINFYQQQSSL